MTIYYDTKDHISILLARRGTVWGKSLFPCVINSALFLAIWFLNERHNIDVSFDAEQLKSLTLFVSFATVVCFDISYTRYTNAETKLMRFQVGCMQLAMKVVIFTGLDKSDDAKSWRKSFKRKLIRFIECSMEMVQDPEKVSEYLSKTNSSSRDDGPFDLISPLAQIISQQGKFLKEPLQIQKEIAMFCDLQSAADNLADLYVISSCQTPFPLVNVLKIVIYVWILCIPFFQADFITVNLPMVFFITFSIVGLDAVANEITDPFGDDPNDLPVEEKTKTTIFKIERLLDGDARQYFDVTQSEHDEDVNKPPTNFRVSQTGRMELIKNQQLGLQQLKLNNFDQAIHFFEQASRFSSEPHEIVFISEMIGDVYAIQCLRSEAIEYYRKAIDLPSSCRLPDSNTFIQKRILSKTCNILFESAEYFILWQSHIVPILRAVSKTDVSGPWDSLAKSIHFRHRLGLLYFFEGDIAVAIEHFWSALRFKRKMQHFDDESYWTSVKGREVYCNEIDVATLLFCIGLCHQENKQHDWAISSFSEAMIIHQRQTEKARHMEMMASTLARLGYSYAKFGRKEESKRARNESRQLALSVSATRRIANDSLADDKFQLKNRLWQDTQLMMKNRSTISAQNSDSTFPSTQPSS